MRISVTNLTTMSATRTYRTLCELGGAPSNAVGHGTSVTLVFAFSVPHSGKWVSQQRNVKRGPAADH